MSFDSSLRIEKIDDREDSYTVYRALLWETSTHKILIPAGFTTDLTTWWVEGRHTKASVLHDFCLDKLKYSRKEANYIMREAMRDLKVEGFMENIIYAGITLYGWFM